MLFPWSDFQVRRAILGGTGNGERGPLRVDSVAISAGQWERTTYQEFSPGSRSVAPGIRRRALLAPYLARIVPGYDFRAVRQRAPWLLESLLPVD